MPFDAIAFAGGGSRCYWQGGVWEAMNVVHVQKPQFIVALSGGAFQASFNLAGAGNRVRQAVIEGCNARASNYEFKRLFKGKSPFVVGELYPQLMELALGEAEFAALRATFPIYYQLSHPPRFMPAMLATYAAIAAYQLEKKLTDGSYSKAGLYIGMRPSTISSHEMKDVAELRAAVLASGTVPPFMPVTTFRGRVAVDGGLVDNPPVQLLKPIEDKGGRTLVLATRFAPTHSQGNRVVLRPSSPINVDKFSITDGEGIKAAFEQGLRDGAAFMKEYA